MALDQALLTAQAGLFTSPNPFGASPPGGLETADNCVIRDQGIIESRRGFRLHSALANGSQLSSFATFTVAVAGTGADNLQYWTGSSWTPFGTVTPPAANTPNRFFTAQDNLYVTSGTGLQRTDTDLGTTVDAGLLQPISIISLSTGSFGGSATWFANGSTVGYRVVILDNRSGHPIQSPPSAPRVLKNSSGSATGVSISLFPASLIQALVPGQAIQIYRTISSPVGGNVGVDYFLAFTIPYAVFTGTVFIADTIPDQGLGEALYTSTSQSQTVRENSPPPLSADACQFKGYSVYANCVDYHRLSLTTPSINSANGLLAGDTLTFSFNGGPSVTLEAGSGFGGSFIQFQSQTLDGVMQSLADTVNANATLGPLITAQYLGAGSVAFQANSLTSLGFSISISAAPRTLSTGTMKYNPSPTVVVTDSSNPFAAGAFVVVHDAGTHDAHFANGTFQVAAASATSWSYVDATGAATNTTNASTYTATHYQPWTAWVDDSGNPLVSGTATSSNDADPATIRISKLNQPECCPLVDSSTVGTSGVAIRRLIPLRDSVLVLKDAPDGVWKLNFTSPDNLQIVPYDMTTFIAAPESAVAMSDNVLFLSTKGPVGMGESTGVFPLAPSGSDCQIRETLLQLLANANTTTLTIGRAYESEKLYLLWTPSNGTDTANTQAWVFNAAQSAWTRWPGVAVDALVDPVTNSLITLDGTNVYQERKDFAATDYQDVGGTASITATGSDDQGFDTITMVGPGVGDLITQNATTGRVVSVAAGNVLTLDTDSGAWHTSPPATYQRAIRCEVQNLPWAGGGENPAAGYKFLEAAFSFRTLGAGSIAVTFSTDVDPDTESLTVAGSSIGTNSLVRVDIPRNKSSGAMVSLGFVHQSALNNFQLQGTSLLFRPVNTRLGRGRQ